MANDTAKLKALMKRVQPLVDAIDVDREATPEMKHDFSVAAISGTEMSELAKKLLMLRIRGEITSDQYRTILTDHYGIA